MTKMDDEVSKTMDTIMLALFDDDASNVAPEDRDVVRAALDALWEAGVEEGEERVKENPEDYHMRAIP